ncbi:MAG: polyamine aminopropyltransferase [Clostridia bacterium]|nr:polyamine aminopropyltransferase [Clostridia bacterium]
MIQESPMNTKPLLFATFFIAICGIVYELIISSISSYLLGNSVKQFSITIGLYMSAMGLGSYISKYFKNRLFDCFCFIELGVGILGSLSAVILFYFYAYTNLYVLMMYLIVIVIGILVGLEIPILTRIIEENNNDLRLTLSNVFTFDYIGALVGSIAFPLVLFPHLGFIVTSFLIGAINIVIAGLVIYYYNGYVNRIKFVKLIFFLCSIIAIGGIFFGNSITASIENDLYRDQVVFSKQTQYQKIILTKHKDDLRMFLDGNIQFSSVDEYRYHEGLVHPIMSLAPKREKVLILGGGDGLALREVLKYNDVKDIVLCDIDKEIVDLCRTNPLIASLNNHSLDSSKLKVVNEDAYKFLENNQELFDVVIVDLPDPNNESLNKLYTNLFYRLLSNSLSRHGKMVVQSTSPFYASEAFWCVNKTIQSEGLIVKPYHLEVPSFGDWGFQLASKIDFDIEKIRISVDSKYLSDEIIPSLFNFGKDEKTDMDSVKINSMSNPVLLLYYEKAQQHNF